MAPPFAEETPRVREKIGDFLQECEPDADQFAFRVRQFQRDRRLRSGQWTAEDDLRWVVNRQAANARLKTG